MRKGLNIKTDLTVGDPLKVTVLFALPIFISNILQQLYNLTDMSIIGHALGDDALSAIGSVSVIYNMFNSLLFGMGNGISIVISRYFGANDIKGLKKAVANTFFLAVGWIILITTIATTTLKPLMKLLNTQEELTDAAYSYVIIMLSLIVFPFTYNILSGLLRAIGNSIAPLVFLVISVTTNIGLDLLFVVGLGKGLPGAAFATVISQALCSLVCFIYIVKFVPELHFGKEDFKPNRGMIADLFAQGISFGLMFMVVNMGTVILQSAINGFGKTTIAAHATARKISELCMMSLSTLATAMSTFSGQNFGAGRYDRIKEGLRKVLFCGFGIASFLIVVIYTFGEHLVRLISGSSNANLISTAVFYLKVDLPFYYVLAVIVITRCVLQGMGAKIVPLIASIMELVTKIITASWLAHVLGYTGIAICEPITWSICALYIVIVFIRRIKVLDTADKDLHSVSDS